MKRRATLTVGLFSLAAMMLVAASSSLSAPDTTPLRLQTFDTRMESADVDAVCCKLGHRVWWSGARQCTGAGRRATSDSACAARHASDDFGQNICCHKDGNQWWSTNEKCATVSGRATLSDTCGVEWNNHVPHEEVR